MGTYSASSISHSTKSQSRHSAAATDPPAAKRAKRTPNATEGNGTPQSVDDADDGGDKYDDEDILSQPQTVPSWLQVKTLCQTCSLLKKQQNLLRSTSKNS